MAIPPWTCLGLCDCLSMQHVICMNLKIFLKTGATVVRYAATEMAKLEAILYELMYVSKTDCMTYLSMSLPVTRKVMM